MISLVDFVKRLEERRTELGMSHRAFATYLGVSNAYWSLVRRGLKPARTAFIGRVISSHPELVAFLPRKDDPVAA